MSRNTFHTLTQETPGGHLPHQMIAMSPFTLPPLWPPAQGWTDPSMSRLLTTMIPQDPTLWCAQLAFIKTSWTQTGSPGLHSTTTTKSLPAVYLIPSLQDTQTQATTHNVAPEELLLVTDELPVDLLIHSSMIWTGVGLLLQNIMSDLPPLLQGDSPDKDLTIMRLKDHKLWKFHLLR